MNLSLIKNILATILLILVQVMVLNQIHLFACATPLLYVYVTAMFRRNTPRWLILVWCFITGVTIDSFSNTPGVAAASLTLTGFLQPMVLMIFTNRDTADDLLPTMRTLGPRNFFLFMTILTTIHCLTFFLLEAFTLYNWTQVALNFTCSTLLTLALIFALENLRMK